MDTTPWWAVPLAGGAFAIIGVAIAQSITIHLERRRRAREDHHRLDVALRECALKYIAAVQDYATFVTALNVGDVLVTGKPSTGRDSFWDYSEKTRAVDETIADLTLSASPQLLELAERFHEPWARFNRAVQGAPITERLKYAHADEAYNLVQPFRNAVREYLGLEPLPEHGRSNLARWAKD